MQGEGARDTMDPVTHVKPPSPAVRPANAVLLAALTVALAAALFWVSYEGPAVSPDDPTWYHRSIRWPFHCRQDKDYEAAVDVPALNRWCYGAVLKATGLDDLPYVPPEKLPVPPSTARQHFWRWIIAPGARLAMRATNAVFFAAALVLLWQVVLWALKSWWLAALAVSSLAASRDVSVIVARRAGPDVFLVFGLALVLILWQYFHVNGKGTSWKAVLAVGIAAGLAAAAKINGALALLAYSAYLVVHVKGSARFIRPVAACALAYAVFCVINPVMVFSGRWPWEVVYDIFTRRFEVIAKLNEVFGTETRWELIAGALPWWPALPLGAVAQVLAVRRFRWMEPLSWWGAFLLLGTIFTINKDFPWYVAPAHLGLYFPSAVALIAVTRQFLADHIVLTRRGAREESSRDDAAVESRT